MAERHAFTYLREPLFVAAALAYVANTLWWKPCTADRASFVHCYLGDVLCMPVLMPVALWLQRRCGLRGHDQAPTPAELCRHWLLWSGCFEWLGPRLPLLAPGAVGDPWDVVSYAAGGLLAGCWWCRGEVRGGTRGGTALLTELTLALSLAVVVLFAYRVGAELR